LTFIKIEPMKLCPAATRGGWKSGKKTAANLPFVNVTTNYWKKHNILCPASLQCPLWSDAEGGVQYNNNPG
jgi:hypothetical protein